MGSDRSVGETRGGDRRGAIALLLLFVGSPFLFGNLRSDHAWGGDFAMYIAHARNLLSGLPYAETGYVYNPAMDCFGTKVYPPGLPILLLPCIAISGTAIAPMLLQQACFLALLGLALFWSVSRVMPRGVAALCTLVLWTSPWILSFKENILSDLPFTALLFAIWLLMESPMRGRLLILMVLVPLLMLTRSTGMAVPMSLLMYACLHPWLHRVPCCGLQEHALYRARLPWILLIVWPMVAVVTVTRMLAVPKSQGYLAELDLQNLHGVILANLDEYLHAWMSFFPSIKALEAPGQVMASVILTFALIGAVSRIRNLAWWDLMILVYVGMLLVWPCVQGFRFILPIVPFLLLYALEGSKLLPWGWWPARIVLLFWLALNLCALLVADRDDSPRGPFHPDAVEMFEAVELQTEEGARVDFFKPRVMALYGHRLSGYPVSEHDPAFDAHYRVTRLQHQPVAGEVLVWKGTGFALWRLPSDGSTP